MACISDPDVELEYFTSRLEYKRLTGEFYWKWCDDMSVAWNRKHVGKRAGTVNSHGRLILRFTIEGRVYRMSANRVAWFMVNGEWPEKLIDHRDRDPLNNAYDNLREANHSQNGANSRGRGSSSGFKGVYVFKERFVSFICFRGVKKNLGYFNTAYEAARAYDAKAREVFGSFAHTNFKDHSDII